MDIRFNKFILIAKIIIIIFAINILTLIYFNNRTFIYSELGNHTYQYKLGKYYYDKNELEKSKKWFEKSSHSGMPEASFYLGLIYFKKQTNTYNEAQALKYFSEAGKGGIREGSFNAALILLYSKNISKRDDIAIPILEELGKSGYYKAARLLGIYYYFEETIPLNTRYDKASYWFKKDIDLCGNYSPSYAYLAKIYSNDKYKNYSHANSLEFKNKAISPFIAGEEIRIYEQWRLFAEMSKIK